VNRLAAETSPYLRQHADNPVDWYPWGDEAFARAHAEDLPVFLSVGYSSCHWCHVMAHESFEDAQVAEVLNARFVPVKVDREERPDVDAVYMEAVQALSGHGGWPMSVFLAPDGRPFYGGTYFPPRDTHGMPSFHRVLDAVDDAWHNRRDEVERQADALAEAIGRRTTVPDDLVGAGHDIDPSARAARLLAIAGTELTGRFDAAWGGFGPAPKFPQPTFVEVCLRRFRLTGDPAVLAMATTTLAAMATGGIYDHVGGGFARYATDATWTVPHFEKMLYDQAGLVRAYLHAWQVTGDARWRQVVDETVRYVRRDLAAPGGGLCAAEDADSEGEEGRFYVWTPGQLRAALGEPGAAVAEEWYQVTPAGNFEGRSILRRPLDGPLARPPEVEAARAGLEAARAGRVRPGRDDKVLTEWNAMFCSSLAEAAAATGDSTWGDAAVEIAEFLFAALRRRDGRWLRSWHEGDARHLAYAGDYAWLVDCCTRLAELTGRALWLERATETARAMLALFGDVAGPLHTTGTDAEALVVRPVDLFDGAMPSANSVAAVALARLGALTGDDDLSKAGSDLLAAMVDSAERHPLALANVVLAAGCAGGAVTEVVVAGHRPDLVDATRRRFEPTLVLAWGERTPSPLWHERADGAAYVCRRYTCRVPAHDVGSLERHLDAELEADRAAARAARVAPAAPEPRT
jgi:uncharacterized protein YyaL (SSP411 family)